MENQIKCPECGSTQITANKKGFSAGKAIVGGLLTGGIGLAAGAIGSGKIIITCLACGHKFKPGEGKKESDENNYVPPVYESEAQDYSTNNNSAAIIITIAIAVVIFLMIKYC